MINFFQLFHLASEMCYQQAPVVLHILPTSNLFGLKLIEELNKNAFHIIIGTIRVIIYKCTHSWNALSIWENLLIYLQIFNC
jgi:hypothetical protein